MGAVFAFATGDPTQAPAEVIGSGLEIEVVGEGEKDIARDETNLIYSTIAFVFAKFNKVRINSRYRPFQLCQLGSVVCRRGIGHAKTINVRV